MPAARGRREAPGREFDDDRGAGLQADVLPAREAAGAAAEAPEGEAGEVRVTARLLGVAALRDVDEAERLVVVDGERGALAQDEASDRASLGLRPGLGAGARPMLGRVAVEVDAAGVRAGVVREAVGVEVLDQEQLATGRRRGVLERRDDAAAGGLVAVDLADDEDLAGGVRVADARDGDRAVLDGVADHGRGQERRRDHRFSARVVTTAS
jgi:hypothetical protein